MAKPIPVTEQRRDLVIRAWSNGNRTYREISLLTDTPFSTVRLIIDTYIKEQMKPLKVKLSQGVQLKLV